MDHCSEPHNQELERARRVRIPASGKPHQALWRRRREANSMEKSNGRPNVMNMMHCGRHIPSHSGYVEHSGRIRGRMRWSSYVNHSFPRKP